MISTKETNEIQRKNGRWYEREKKKKKGRTAAKKMSEETKPKDQARCKMK